MNFDFSDQICGILTRILSSRNYIKDFKRNEKIVVNFTSKTGNEVNNRNLALFRRNQNHFDAKTRETDFDKD